MRLSARILANVSGINAFSYANQADLTEGDTPIIYFQLVDLTRDRADQGFVPAGRRYVPTALATLEVTLDHIDATRKVVRMATQPFPQDPSIWAVTLTTLDKLRGTVNMKLVLTETGGKVTSGLLSAALRVQALSGMTRI
jgi:hypothetical protein